jgi:hypothetical protein
MGSALATLACYFSMAAICWWLGNRYFPIPYPMLRLGAWLLLAVGLVATTWYLDIESYWLRHAFHLLVCLAFVGGIFLIERPDLTRNPAVPIKQV